MDTSRALRLLAITGGHRVDLDAFTGMLAGICAERGWVFAHAVQPAAQDWLGPDQHGMFDAILCHDLPGLEELKGTGLLDSRLPTGFSVPTPSDDPALREDEEPLETGDLELALSSAVEPEKGGND